MNTTTPDPLTSDELDARLMALAHKRGKNGFAIPEVVIDGTFTSKRLEYSVKRLTERGRLFRGKLGHTTMRLFAQRSWADDYARMRRTSFNEGAVARPKSASWGPDDPIDGHHKDFKGVTVCPPCVPPPNARIRTGTHWET